jgi:hypothetical protein
LKLRRFFGQKSALRKTKKDCHAGLVSASNKINKSRDPELDSGQGDRKEGS